MSANSFKISKPSFPALRPKGTISNMCFRPTSEYLTTLNVVAIWEVGHFLGACRHTHLLTISDSACSFLPVTTGKLVADLRYANGTNSDLAELVSILI